MHRLTIILLILLATSVGAQDSTYNVQVIDQSIELDQFRAHHNVNRVELTWTTLSELNNQRFVLERSQDGQHFDSIQGIAGAGISSGAINYFEVDWAPLPKVSYYRLKQVDFNGDFSYSGVVPVQALKPNQVPDKLFEVELTSENGMLDIDKLKDKEVLVVLRNEKGVEFYSRVRLNTEKKKLCGKALDSTIPKGDYLITASSINEIYSKKLCIL